MHLVRLGVILFLKTESLYNFVMSWDSVLVQQMHKNGA